jgi:S1-C subfamily serine protease
MAAHQPGQTITLTYLRNGTRHTTQAQLAAQPNQTSPASTAP